MRPQHRSIQGPALGSLHPGCHHHRWLPHPRYCTACWLLVSSAEALQVWTGLPAIHMQGRCLSQSQDAMSAGALICISNRWCLSCMSKLCDVATPMITSTHVHMRTLSAGRTGRLSAQLAVVSSAADLDRHTSMTWPINGSPSLAAVLDCEAHFWLQVSRPLRGKHPGLVQQRHLWGKVHSSQLSRGSLHTVVYPLLLTAMQATQGVHLDSQQSVCQVPHGCNRSISKG